MLGSSGGLGFGFAFTLEDKFTDTAHRVESSFKKLGDTTAYESSRMDAALRGVSIGTGLLTAGAALATPLIATANKASDLSEAMTKANVVFGQSDALVKQFASNTAESLGISERAAMEATGTYGNLFTSLKLGKKQAAEYSTTLTALGADLASFNNTKIEDALYALRAGMVGETEPLKRYGVVLNEHILEQKALQMGLIKSTKGHLSDDPLKKMLAAYQVILEQTKNAQGDFIRTGDGYANMKRKITAAYDNLQTDLGKISISALQDLSQVLLNILHGARAFVNSPIGGFLIRLTIILGVLTAAFGLFILVTNAAKFGMYQLAFAFGETTRVMIWQQLAAGNLRNAYVLMKTSLLQSLTAMRLTWLSMFLGNIAAGNLAVAFGMLTSKIRTTFAALWANPFMKYALIFGAIALAISKATSEFEKMEYKASGLKGTFQTLGGFIQVMKEAFNSWDAKTGTFSILETTAQKLENLGILRQVIALGTWVVRFYEFGKGVLSVFGTIGNAIGEIMDFAGHAVDVALAWISEKLGANIGKWLGITDNASSKITKWFNVGRLVGALLLWLIIVTTAAWVSFGLASVVSTAKAVFGIGRMTVAWIRAGAASVVSTAKAVFGIGRMTVAWIRAGAASFVAMLPTLGVLASIIIFATALYFTYKVLSDAWDAMLLKTGVTKGSKWFKDMSMFGKALIVVLGLMAVAWYYVAAAELAAFLIPLAIAAAVIATIMILYVLLTRGGEIWTWFKQKAVDALMFIGLSVYNTWKRFAAWVGGMRSAGSQMISNFWDGAKSKMGAFVEWFINQLLKIPILGDSLRLTLMAGEAIGNAIFGDNTPQAAEPIPAYSANNVGMQVGSYRGSLAANSAVAAQNTNPNLWKSNIVMNNHLHLDGEKIATSVNNYNEFNESRGE